MCDDIGIKFKLPYRNLFLKFITTRSDTPLIYRAVPSWFIRVEHMSKELLESNSKTYW